MDRWFLLGSYGPQARFHMIAAWTTLAGLVCVEMVWLSFSRLSFADSNWDSVIRLLLFTAIVFGFCGLVSHRLAGATDRVGCALREGARRLELFAVAMLLFGLLAVIIVAYCFLGTAAALPFQDARLARIDQWLGFNWVAFVEFVNSSALASWLLVEGYRSTPYMLVGTILWLCVSGPSVARLRCAPFSWSGFRSACDAIGRWWRASRSPMPDREHARIPVAAARRCQRGPSRHRVGPGRSHRLS
jgi:hypothetical protein